MNNATLFASLARLTAASMSLDDIEEILNATCYPSRICGNRTVWNVRLPNGDSYPLERSPHDYNQFTISDPLCRMADGMDAMDDYYDEMEQRMAGERGLL